MSTEEYMRAKQELELLMAQEREREIRDLYFQILEDVGTRLKAERSHFIIFLWGDNGEPLGTVASLKEWKRMKNFAFYYTSPSEEEMENMSNE